jgi:homocysteine S-methyltransferase
MRATSPDNPFLHLPPHQRALILDGGLATTLESRGFDLNDRLWSARLLLDAPDAIRQVHRDFLAAGADVITTASYQGSVAGFAERGIAHTEGVRLLQSSVSLAVQARDAFWRTAAHRIGRRRPLVAASVGPYGACLADGSEYTGLCPVDDDALHDFHRDRCRVLCECSADLLAFETIGNIREVAVLAQLLSEHPQWPAWLSFCCRDGTRLSDGTPVAEAARLCEPVPNLVAVGVNCTRPQYITSLLRELRPTTTRPLIVYPNAGEEYDVEARAWRGGQTPLDWGRAAARWAQAGARGIGGCCRVGPAQIALLREALVTRRC